MPVCEITQLRNYKITQSVWTLYNVKPPEKNAAHKTNAARLLDQLGIAYELRSYEVDENDLAAETVAAKIGLPAEQVFKTLVARGDRNGVCFAVVPADAHLDEKALARLTGDRKVEL